MAMFVWFVLCVFCEILLCYLSSDTAAVARRISIHLRYAVFMHVQSRALQMHGRTLVARFLCGLAVSDEESVEPQPLPKYKCKIYL